MNKRILYIFIVMVFLLFLAGCDGNKVVTEDGKTNNDLKAEYIEAKKLVSEGEYEEAIAMLDGIPETYNKYNDVVSARNNAINQYVDDIATESDNLSAEGKNIEALNLLEQAKTVAGDNPLINSREKALHGRIIDEVYLQAKSLLDEKEYEKASALIAEAPSFVKEDGDIKKIIEECAIVPTDEFIKFFEDSITQRMNESKNSDIRIFDMVEAEKDRLDAYSELTIQDSELDALYRKYQDGVNYQYEALRDGYPIGSTNGLDLKWEKGFSLRLRALYEIYHAYDFMKDNSEFYDTYIYDSERNVYRANDREEVYNCVEVIYNDITRQFPVGSNVTETENRYLTIYNGTNYAYSGEINVDVVGENNQVIDRLRFSFDMAPGESFGFNKNETYDYVKEYKYSIWYINYNDEE